MRFSPLIKSTSSNVQFILLYKKKYSILPSLCFGTCERKEKDAAIQIKCDGKLLFKGSSDIAKTPLKTAITYAHAFHARPGNGGGNVFSNSIK